MGIILENTETQQNLARRIYLFFNDEFRSVEFRHSKCHVEFYISLFSFISLSSN